MTSTYEETLLELREHIMDPLVVIEQLQSVKSFEEIKEILRQAL